MLGKMEVRVRPMQYPVLAGASTPAVDLESPADLVANLRQLESRLEEREKQFVQELETVRREAFQRGRQEALGEQTAWRRQSSLQLSAALEEFCARRDDYLSRVEQEVVRLALAIAERVIRREAQMDPLLLAGAVRVALGQLAESTEVRLRVPAEQKELWAEMLRLIPGLAVRAEVVADPELQPAQAILEAAVGTVNLGVRAQIAEIERGFFDLLEARQLAGALRGDPVKPDDSGAQR